MKMLIFQRGLFTYFKIRIPNREVFHSLFHFYFIFRIALGSNLAFQVSHVGSSGSYTWAIFCCFFQAISRGLEWSGVEPEMEHLRYKLAPFGIPVCQAVALPTVPQG